MKKILLILTSADELSGEETGYELSEAAHPWKVFRDAGYAVDFASVQGGTPTPYSSSDEEDPIVDEFTADDTVNAQMLTTPKLENVDAAQYDAVYLVGGHGTMVDFPDSQPLKQILADVVRAGGLVGAVCHGPAGLLDVPLDNGMSLLTGKRVTGFSDAEEQAAGKADAVPFSLEGKLTDQAERYVPAPEPMGEQVVVDDFLITGANPASAAAVAKEMSKLLAERIQAEKAAEEAAAAELRAEKDAEKEAAEEE